MKSTMFLISMFFLPFACFSQWEWQSPKPGNKINSVWFTDSNTGYTVGWDGMIFKTTDGGENWNVNLFNHYYDFKFVCFPEPNVGYVVGQAGTILKTTDAGNLWSFLNSGTDYNLKSISFINADTGYVVGSDLDNYATSGIILKTTDGGESWLSLTYSGMYPLNSVVFLDANIGYIGGEEGIQKTTDGGNSWINIDMNSDNYPINGLCFNSPDTGFARTPNDIFKTTDGGLTWHAIIEQIPDYIEAMYFYSNNNGLYSCEFNGDFSYLGWTTNGGLTWNNINNFAFYPQNINAFYQTNENTIYAVGNSFAYKTINGAASWSSIQQGTSNNLYSVFFINADTGFAGGNNGIIVKTTTGGEHWNIIHGSEGDPDDEFNRISSIFFNDANHGIAVGGNFYYDDNGIILQTNDGGITWNQVWYSQLTNFTTVFFSDSNTGYVCGYGYDMFYLKTTNGGSTWTMINTSFLCDKLFFVNSNLGYITSNNLVYKTNNAGQNWTLIYTALYKINSICFIDNNIGFISSGCNIYKTIDGGTNWSSVLEISSESPYYYYFKSIKFYNQNYGVAVGTYGLTYYTNNCGLSWHYTKTVKSVLNDVCLFDSNKCYVIGDLGIILKNTNINNNYFAEEVYSPQPDIQPANNVNIVASNTEAFTYYYNATSKMLYISSDKNTTNTSVQILDMNGKLVLPAINLNQRTISINASSLSKGVYVLKMNNQQKVECKKLIIN